MKILNKGECEMKLTVVTTTYNQEEYIGQAIDGMLMQKTNFPFQIVISNDCSTDKTGEILKEYELKYPEKIKIINNKKNLGAMGNFINTLSGIKDTEYVALCDGDDFWTDENKLQKQVDFLDNNKEFNICFHKSRMFYQDNEKEESIIPKNVKEITQIDDLVKSNYIVANSVVYRWKFNNKNLKEIFSDDIVPGDYYISLLHAEDGKIKMINEVMSAYRRHKDGMWWEDENRNRENFTLKYGKRVLNFYNVAETNIKLPENAFLKQRKDMIYNIIVTYIKNDKVEELYETIKSKKDKEIFSSCMKDIVNRNIWFLDYLEQREEQEKQQKQEKEDYLETKKMLEQIENSRWWKLRNIIKGNKNQ